MPKRELVCKNCQTEFSRRYAKNRRGGEGTYCSYRCRGIDRTDNIVGPTQEKARARRSLCKVPVASAAVNYIALSESAYTTIDQEDFNWSSQSTWWLGPTGYATRSVWSSEYGKIGQRINLHREVLERSIGRQLSASEMVDHINRDRLDNRRCNLRVATKAQNCINRPSNVGSSSIYKGVSWSESRKKWVAATKVDKQPIYIGRFVDEEYAAYMYDMYVKGLFGEFAYLNFDYQ